MYLSHFIQLCRIELSSRTKQTLVLKAGKHDSVALVLKPSPCNGSVNISEMN